MRRYFFIYCASLVICLLQIPPLQASDTLSPIEGRLDFLIIGGLKCGTSSLFHYMKKHPNIRTGPIKELHFFNKQYEKSSYDKGIDWYISQFPEKESGGPFFLNCEASAGYFENPTAPEEIAHYFPNIKIIILIRNPIDRALSIYKMALRLGVEKNECSHEILFVENMQKYRYNPTKWDRYVFSGVYRPQIQEWRKYYPDDQIHIICSKDLFSNPDRVMNEVYQFLGLSPFSLEYYMIWNKSSNNEIVLSPELKKQMENFYAPYNRELQLLLKNEMKRDIDLASFGWCME